MKEIISVLYHECNIKNKSMIGIMNDNSNNYQVNPKTMKKSKPLIIKCLLNNLPFYDNDITNEESIEHAKYIDNVVISFFFPSLSIIFQFTLIATVVCIVLISRNT